MPIEFLCSGCQKKLRVADDAAGKQAKCPQCGAVITVPQGAAPEEQSPFSFTPSQGSSAFTPPPSAPAPQKEVNPYQSPAVESQRPPMSPAAPGQIGHGVLDAGMVFSRSWELFQAQMGMCIGGIVVYALISFGISFLTDMLTNVASLAGPEIGIAMIVVTTPLQFVIDTFLSLGLAIFLLNMVRGRNPQISDFFAGGPYLLRGLGANLLFGLMILAIFAVTCLPGALIGWAVSQSPEGAMVGALMGMVVALIPVIVVSLMFSQINFLIVDHKLGVMDSLAYSKKITDGNKGSLFLVFLMAGLIVLAGFLALCVGIIFAGPFAALLPAMAYLAMSAQPSVLDGDSQYQYRA